MKTLHSQKSPWAAIAVFFVLWFALDGAIAPPDFGQTDIYYFKDAGINLAEGLGLTTRFTFGNPTFDYKDYAHYPPLYPGLFGIFVRLFGVSARSNQCFNSLIAAVTGLLGFLALRPAVIGRLEGSRRFAAEISLACPSLLCGYFYFSYDRPDGLGVALGLGSLIFATRFNGFSALAASGVLCAIALFTSPYAGVWSTLATSIALLTAPLPLLVRARHIGAFSLVGILTTAVTLGLLRLMLPGWFDGFLGVASGSHTNNETGGGYFLALLHLDFHTWWGGFAYSQPSAYLLLAKLCVVVAALAGTLAMHCRTASGRRHAKKLLLLLTITPLGLIGVPYQSNYCTVTAALLLAAWAGIETMQLTERRRVTAAVIALAFGLTSLLSLPFQMRTMAMRMAAGDSLQPALDYLVTHRDKLETRDGYCAVSPSNYILWRQAGLHPLINIYSGFKTSENRDRIDVLALSFPGSGDPMRPQAAEFIPEADFQLTFEPPLPHLATLFGHSLSNSSQTWGDAIYQRR